MGEPSAVSAHIEGSMAEGGSNNQQDEREAVELKEIAALKEVRARARAPACLCISAL